MDIKIEPKDEVLEPDGEESSLFDAVHQNRLYDFSYKAYTNENSHHANVKQEEVEEVDLKENIQQTVKIEEIQWRRFKEEVSRDVYPVKLEPYDVGECSYAERKSEQITKPNNQSSIPINHSEVNLVEVKAEKKYMKEEISTREPVAVIVLNKRTFHKRNFVCSVCFDIFTSLEFLESHKKVIHNEIKSNTEVIFKCAHCPYKCKARFDFEKHIQAKHTGDKPYKCHICDYKSVEYSSLKGHMLWHTRAKRPFECDRCYRSFSRRHALKVHTLVHTKDLPHKCDICDFKTTHVSLLKEHKMNHSRDNPNCCGLCEFKSKSTTHLKQHMASHYIVKPFKCDQCSFVTAGKTLLNRHMKTHSDYWW